MEEDIDPEVLAQRLRQALRRMEATSAEFNREQQWDVYHVDCNGQRGRLVHSGFHRDIADTMAAAEFLRNKKLTDYGLFRHNSDKPETLYTKYPKGF